MELRRRLANRLRTWVKDQDDTASGPHQARVLAIASNKGGVGKTTSAVNIAAGCAKRGIKVLLIDLDPQAHVSAALQCPPSPECPPLSDVLLGRRQEVAEIAYPSRIPGLDLVGGDKHLGETEMVLASKIGKELLLQQSIQQTRTHYELIIIDCPPNLGTLTLNGLCAADALLIPTDMSVLAVEGVADILVAVRTLQQRLNHPLDVAGILITRLDKRSTRANGAVEESLVELRPAPVMQSRIPQCSAINRAHMAGVSVLEFAPASTGARAYQAATAEICATLKLAKKAKVA